MRDEGSVVCEITSEVNGTLGTCGPVWVEGLVSALKDCFVHTVGTVYA